MSYQGKISSSEANTIWFEKRGLAERDLVLKKIAISIIALLNFAALGVALYYIVAYVPIPTQALIVSPFIVGALAALSNIKFPTLGISSHNYTHYVNPLSLLGRGVAYLFFGPLMYVANRTDWNPYHDHEFADTLSGNLEEISFVEIADACGRHFSNLTRYGFIDSAHKETLKTLYKEYKISKRALDHYTEAKRRGLKAIKKLKDKTQAVEIDGRKKKDLKISSDLTQIDKKLAELNKKIENFEQRWSQIKAQCTFPHPQLPEYDFSKKSTRFKLKARSCLLFMGNPLNLSFQA